MIVASDGHAGAELYAYREYLLGEWGEQTSFSTVARSPFSEVLGLHIERPIFETLAAIICHGVFDPHPTLGVATIELGSSWVPELLQRLKVACGKIPQTFGRDPLEAFRDHIWVTPFQEVGLGLVHLVDLLGADRVLFGSDWPHPEGMMEPVDIVEDLHGLGDHAQRLVTDQIVYEMLRLSY